MPCVCRCGVWGRMEEYKARRPFQRLALGACGRRRQPSHCAKEEKGDGALLPAIFPLPSALLGKTGVSTIPPFCQPGGQLRARGTAGPLRRGRTAIRGAARESSCRSGAGRKQHPFPALRPRLVRIFRQVRERASRDCVAAGHARWSSLSRNSMASFCRRRKCSSPPKLSV